MSLRWVPSRSSLTGRLSSDGAQLWKQPREAPLHPREAGGDRGRLSSPSEKTMHGQFPGPVPESSSSGPRTRRGRGPRRPALARSCGSGLVLQKDLAVFLPTPDPPSACPVWENGIKRPPRPGTLNRPEASGTGRLPKARASSPALCDTAGLAAHLGGCRRPCSSRAFLLIPRQAPVGIIFRKCTLRWVMPLLKTLVLQGPI